MCEWGPTGAALGFGWRASRGLGARAPGSQACQCCPCHCHRSWASRPGARLGLVATTTCARALWAGSVCAARSPWLLTGSISFEKPLAPGLQLPLPSHPAHPAPGHSFAHPQQWLPGSGDAAPLPPCPGCSVDAPREIPGVTLGAGVTEKAKTSAFLDSSTEGRKGVDQ